MPGRPGGVKRPTLTPPGWSGIPLGRPPGWLRPLPHPPSSHRPKTIILVVCPSGEDTLLSLAAFRISIYIARVRARGGIAVLSPVGPDSAVVDVVRAPRLGA